MTKVFKDRGINKLGTWNYQFENEDLSTLKFFDTDGAEISRPADFPTDEQIIEATAEAQVEQDNQPNVAKAGNDKLLALGLSQDEVTAMTGYRVPSE